MKYGRGNIRFIGSLVIAVDFIFITIILFFSLYLDLRYRRISNRILKKLYISSLILNILEFLLFYNNILLFLAIKSFIFLITFFFSFILFTLKIIGGSDGKLIIIIFTVHPTRYLKIFNIVLFFILLILLYLGFFLINYLINNTPKNSYSFLILFNINLKISTIKREFIKFFYNFYDFSEISDYEGVKKKIRSRYIFYNSHSKKFQLLVQNRPPIIILIIISYYILFFLKIGI